MTLIEYLLEYDTGGDPITGVKWSRRTTAKVALALGDFGITVSANTVARLLEHMGYSLRVNQKQLATDASPDRNEQFLYIRDLRDRFQRILAIPSKRFERGPVEFLTAAEIAALVAAPNAATWVGQRDRTLLLMASQTGLRNSEITTVRRQNVELSVGAHVCCVGKRRKSRCTPLRPDVIAVLKAWLLRHPGASADPLFPSVRSGRRLSADGVQRLVARHVATASRKCPSLKAKKVTPHTLRHAAAMALLRRGVDLTVIALWLGHESTETTQVYLHADMRIKERALAQATPSGVTPKRYRPPDPLLAFLEGL